MDINTAKDVILAASFADDAVIIEGPHGIGKSNIVKQFAQENEYHLEELFLSNQEVGDLIGIPMLENGITTWSKPIWLKRMHDAAKNGKRCILFCDELNRAPIDVRQTAMQLVLERKIHEHELPTVYGERTMVVAAINPSDDYQVDELDPALLDRFLHITVEADVNAFLNWARKNNIDNRIIDFIVEYPDRLHWTPADNGIGTTPRSWAKLSSYLKNSKNLSDDIIFQIFRGKLGAEVGAQFFTFFKQYANILKVEDIEEIVEYNINLDDVESLAVIISEHTRNIESIQKLELAKKLSDTFNQKNVLPFLAYLYSLEIEICVSFLKSYKIDEPDNYRLLAAVDNELNNKELFKRIVKNAHKEEV